MALGAGFGPFASAVPVQALPRAAVPVREFAQAAGVGQTAVPPRVPTAVVALASPGPTDRTRGPGARRSPDGTTPAPAVVTKADYIAGQLAHDPVFISDHVPRDVSPEDAERIRAAVRGMPVPTYLAVVADTQAEDDPLKSPTALIALLHDKLQRPGVYVVMPSNGIGVDAQQFGTNLPIGPAADEIIYSQPYNAGPVRAIQRFVDNIRSGRAQQRYDEAHARSKSGWEPKPYREARDTIDDAQQAGAISGLVVAALGVAFVAWRSRRRPARTRGKRVR
ncbi:hypothetical protein GCM10023196_011320 [Actinoallomurus vinaceus]|uniref:TPM domain-containing protein n=1 Tax=Actinoallomurus vinaceus TaxID=1080074 RepID=A0ABP8U4X6_9ACTN